jgi:hypothetical protein
VTKLASTLAAENRRNPGSPTLRGKIQSRAGNIAGHLRQQQQPYTTASLQKSQQSNMASLPVSDKAYNPNAPSQYPARKIGAPNTLGHRIYIEENGKPLSPFHDIPLYANQEQTILNMIVEVPRWTNAKMEVSNSPSDSLLTRKRMLRHYALQYC